MFALSLEEHKETSIAAPLQCFYMMEWSKMWLEKCPGRHVYLRRLTMEFSASLLYMYLLLAVIAPQAIFVFRWSPFHIAGH